MAKPGELAQFCELLRAFLDGDNKRRQVAERFYQATQQQDPDRLCLCLLTVLTQVPDDTLRQQSAVLLRQCLKYTRADFIWPRIQAWTQEAVTVQLLVALGNERERSTRHKVCDTVSMLACHVLDPARSAESGGGWPKLAPALAQLAEAEDSACRESALRILKDILGTNPPVLQQALLGGSSAMAKLLQACHSDPSPQVRKMSVLLFAAMLEHLPQEEEGKNALQYFMPIMLAVTQQFESNEDELHECLEAFVQVADVTPSVFQPHLDRVVPMMLTICRARDKLMDSTRQLAFEFLVSLCEKRSKACAKLPNFMQEAVALCMEFMLELEEDEDWAEADRSVGVEVSNYDVGEENIDRFAQVLGPEAVLGHIFDNVRRYVNLDSWKHKYVAVMTLSQCVETVQQESHVDEIMGLLVSLLQDQHPRVRFAALHAIGQTSTDHCPYLQEHHNEVILPALLRLMDDPVVRVASHACAALVNFTESLEPELLLPHVPKLMAKLSHMMLSNVRVAREQAITAIAVIAGVMEEDFVPFYQQLVPVLKQILLNATKVEERTLRGKAFECLSVLGLAVGRDVFQQDAKEAMQAMMETASAGLEADDPQKRYIHEAAQRICRALREDFLPYLPYLLPGIYAMLRIQPIHIVDPDIEEETADTTIAFLENGQAVGLKTSQVEDFQRAVQLLACFLDVLRGDYMDHLQDTAQCLLPALSFRFSDDVKREAIQTWQELIRAAREGVEKRRVADKVLVAELLRGFLRSILEAMRSEEDVELLQVQAIGACGCIRAAGPGTMTPDEVRELCAELRRLLGEHLGPQHDAARELDEDEQFAMQQQCDAHHMLRVKCAELAGALMEVHTEHFLLGGMQQLVPVIRASLLPGNTSSDECIGLYIACDMVEKLGQQSVAVWHAFMPQMVEAVANGDAWVRQAAAYGVRHAARLAEFAPFADRASKLLGDVVSHQSAKGEGDCEATEAAVAALGVVCKAHGGRVAGLRLLLLSFLENLPLTEDLDVAAPTHELLMEFVKEGHAFFQEHVGKVCHVFLEIYGRETGDDALDADIRSAFAQAGQERLRQMQPPFSNVQWKKILKIIQESQKKHMN